jgi:hypothetical protein
MAAAGTASHRISGDTASNEPKLALSTGQNLGLLAGQNIEIMGDLERCGAGHWVPTTNLTHMTVDLDGLPISVPGLEENVLANMQRGRLDRANLCLPDCDQEKLRQLLVGEVETNVF